MALWRELVPGLLGSVLSNLLIIGAIARPEMAPLNWRWLLWVSASLLAIAIAIVYLGRRAFWVCAGRSAFLLVFMLSLGIACLIGAMPPLNYDERLLLAFSAVVFFVICAYLIHAKHSVPYWRLAYEQNIAWKIDLRRGVFLVGIPWASLPRTQPTSGQKLIVFGMAPFASLIGITMSRGFAGTLWLPAFFAAGAFFLFAVAAMSETEAYFAYKLLQLERQIGRPIVMDGYQKEDPLVRGSARMSHQ